MYVCEECWAGTICFTDSEDNKLSWELNFLNLNKLKLKTTAIVPCALLRMMEDDTIF